MNRKPGSVYDRHLSRKAVSGLFRAAYPRLADGPPTRCLALLLTRLAVFRPRAPQPAERSRNLSDDVAAAEVGSYPTVSPLPGEPGGLLSVALSVPSRPRPGSYPASCPAEPGLSSRRAPFAASAERRSGSSPKNHSSKSTTIFSSSLSSSSNSSSSSSGS